MPPTRDEHDYEIKRQQIIDGALQVFASKGFEKATNRDIAKAARIGSPGLIYHYFKDKADLYRMVLEERAPALQLLSHSDELMGKPPLEVLTEFGTAFVKTLSNRVSIAMFKLVLSEALRNPGLASVFNRIGPGRGFAFLHKYISHQIETGTFRKCDAGAAVRCFLGPLLAFVFTRELFVQPDAETLKPETMVATAVEIFLRGMEPDVTHSGSDA